MQSIEKLNLSQIEKISELKNENLELKEELDKVKAENSKLVSEFQVKTEVNITMNLNITVVIE